MLACRCTSELERKNVKIKCDGVENELKPLDLYVLYVFRSFLRFLARLLSHSLARSLFLIHKISLSSEPWEKMMQLLPCIKAKHHN